MTKSIPEPITPDLTTDLNITQEQTTFETTDELDATTQNNLDTTTIAGETSTAERTTEVITSTAEMTPETASTTEEITSYDEISTITTSESSSTGESSTTIETTKLNTKILSTTTADTTVRDTTAPDTITAESQSMHSDTEEMSTTTPATSMSDSDENVTSTFPPWAGESTTVSTEKQNDSTTTSPGITTPTLVSPTTALRTSSTETTTGADSTITITTTISTTAEATSTTNGDVICGSEDNDNDCIMSIKGCSMTFEGAYINAYVDIDSVESENLRRHLDPLITKSISANSTFVGLQAIITEITDAFDSKINLIVTIEPVVAGTLIDNDTKIEIKDYLESKQWFDEMDSIWIQELASNPEFKIWIDAAGFKGVYYPDFQIETTSEMTTATTSSSSPITQMTTSTLVSIKSTSTPTTGANSLSNLNATLEFEGDYIEEYKNVDSDEFKQFEELMRRILYKSIGDLSTHIMNFGSIELVRLSKGSIIAEFNITARNNDLDNLERLIGNDQESCDVFIQQSGSKCWESYINDLLSTGNENNQQVPESLKYVTIEAASDNDDVTPPTTSTTSSSVATTTTTAKSSTSTIVTTSTSTTVNSTTTAITTAATTTTSTTTTILSSTTAERPSELYNLTLYSEGDTHEISFNVKADEDYIERAISARNNFIDENPDAKIYLSVVRKVSFSYITVRSTLNYYYSEVQ